MLVTQVDPSEVDESMNRSPTKRPQEPNPNQPVTISAPSPDGFFTTAPLASLLGVDWGQAVVVAALITVFGTILLALLRAVGISMATTREREHELYSEAVRAALAW